MNPNLEISFWTRLLGILALEISLVVALAFIVQLLTHSAFWRRTIWQICFVCLLLLVTTELTGFGRGFAVWFAGKPPVERKFSVRIVPVDEQFVPTPIENEIAPPIEFSEKEAPIVRAVWWPGMLWFAGLALVVARILFARILFLTLRWRKTEITDATLLNRVSELARRLGIRRKIHLLESSGFSSPMTFGIAQPSIALPKNFAQNFSSAEQNAMLTHELAHVAARDPLWYLLADLTSALLWWHPLVWLARRRLHSASELAADEAAAILENGPGTLAECLVNLGQRLTQSRSFGWLGVDGNGFRSHLGQRVERLLNLKETKPNKLRGWPLFFVKTAATIFLGGVIVFISGWIQNGKEQREKNLSAAVQKSWNGSFASMTLAALAVERRELLAKNEIPTTNKVATLPQDDEVTFETLIYNDFSPEQLEEVGRILKPSFSENLNKNALLVSSNELQQVLFSLSKFKERMVSPRDCGSFMAPFDMVGSKADGIPTIYLGNPTNSENNCCYFTGTKNGIRVVTRTEMSYPANHAWSFSVLPQKRDGATEISLGWKDHGKETAKNWTMPKDGGAIVQRRFTDDPSRNQLVVFSSRRLPRKAEDGSDQKPSIRKEESEEILQTSTRTAQFTDATGSKNSIQLKARVYQIVSESPKANVIKGSQDVFNEQQLNALTNLFKTTPGAKLLGTSHLFTKAGESYGFIQLSSKNHSFPGYSIEFLPQMEGADYRLNLSIQVGDFAKEGLQGNAYFKSTKSILVPAGQSVALSSEKSNAKAQTNYVFVLTPSPPTTELYTHVFKLDPEKFMKNLENAFPDFTDAFTNKAAINLKVRNFFTAAGMDFDPIGSTNGKNVFFNDRTGLLMVRTTMDDLQIMQEALENIQDVVISPGTPDEVNLQARLFKVNPQTFPKSLKGDSSQIITTRIKDFLRKEGVNFGSDARPNGKTIFYKDKLGWLTVRATPDDLKIIEQALGPFLPKPPQVETSPR